MLETNIPAVFSSGRTALELLRCVPKVPFPDEIPGRTHWVCR